MREGTCLVCLLLAKRKRKGVSGKESPYDTDVRIYHEINYKGIITKVQ
jgi:hypothetical protein